MCNFATSLLDLTRPAPSQRTAVKLEVMLFKTGGDLGEGAFRSCHLKLLRFLIPSPWSIPACGEGWGRVSVSNVQVSGRNPGRREGQPGGKVTCVLQVKGWLPGMCPVC